ncbi:MAG TPA: ABC transporter permease [Streptosporangiaceae bacterium]
MSGQRIRLPKLMRMPAGAVGVTLLVAVLALAFAGPLLAPDAITATVGPPGQTPAAGMPFGTDFLGRDVLSRLLNGGLSVVVFGTAATALAYLGGVTIGLVAGYSKSVIDPILMRTVDVLLSVPALLILLVLVSGLGPHIWVLVAGVALVQLPGVARVVRTATLEVSTRAYVEAAVTRGEKLPSLLGREVLPNIVPVVLADLGIRFGVSVVLIASMNYLGLGLAPPAADWGLMISENRDYISLNPWSVLGPAIMLALLTISVNLAADAYARSLGRSLAAGRRRRAAAAVAAMPEPAGTSTGAQT